MIRASIDIGSNSCLLCVLDLEESGFRVIESESRITSLGKDLDVNQEFLEESIQRTVKALTEYKAILDSHQISASDVVVTATEASRVAKNFSILRDIVKNHLGFIIQIISGEGEAFYTARGVVSGASKGRDIVSIMDIGGASTELIRVNAKTHEIISSVSLPIGSVRATDWLEKKAFDDNFEKIIKDNNLSEYRTDELICVAGTMTTLAAMLKNLDSFNEDDVEGYEFKYATLSKILGELENKSETEILEAYPICGKRAFSIYGGTLVAKKISEVIDCNSFKISTLGLRHGVLLSGGIDERYI